MLALDPADTIAAIASPAGPGVLGLIRMTGPDAWAVASGGFDSAWGSKPPPRAARVEGVLTVAGLRRPLAAAVGFWPGPRTYTGQPLAEIAVAGAAPVLRAVLADRLGRGARLAEPGEFTLRAFLSGRIDLTQSEAVLGVIDASTPGQLDSALRQLAGGLASPIVGLRDALADTLAHLEANLDFAEEPDVDPLGSEALARSLDRGAATVGDLIGRLGGRDRARSRPRVVLVGPPNAGKSRLFNALAGADRAIVSPVAGTTRDYLEAPGECDGLAVDLVDTAGEDAPSTPIEGRAQALRGDQEATADLVLACRSGDSPPPIVPPAAPGRPRLEVWTKVDAWPPLDRAALATSAATGEGLAALRVAIARALRALEGGSDAVSGTASRCSDALSRAEAAIRRAAGALRLGLGDELVAVDLREALDDLGRVVGAVVTDDLLDRIFRRFCIGK